MGMLKTAARTALTDGRDEPGGAVLSELMQTLNQVLPLWRWIVEHLPAFEAARVKPPA